MPLTRSATSHSCADLCCRWQKSSACHNQVPGLSDAPAPHRERIAYQSRMLFRDVIRGILVGLTPLLCLFCFWFNCVFWFFSQEDADQQRRNGVRAVEQPVVDSRRTVPPATR